MDTFKAVGEFHAKFDLATVETTPPALPDASTLCFRAGFMLEELAETVRAMGLVNLSDVLTEVNRDLKRHPVFGVVVEGAQDLEKVADGLGDLKYVVDGTAHMCGIPLNEIFDEIQRANMAKERATGDDDARSVRGHRLDVVKPEGWTAPNLTPILLAHAAKFA